MSASHEWIQLFETCNILRCMILKQKEKGKNFPQQNIAKQTVSHLLKK